MKTKHLTLLLLLLLGSQVYSQEVQVPTKTNEFRVGFKTGRTFFTNPVELGGLSSHVFYGQLSLDYGVCRSNKLYYGLGVGAEHIDLLESGVSVPIHAELRYYFTGDATEGAFLDVEAGYVFCGNQTFPIIETQGEQEITVGQTVRKLSGPYGEISVGYRIQRFDFQVGYGYRVTHYSRSIYQPDHYHLDENNFFKPLHTLMAGVSYKIF